jgi:hypothetical protein
VKIVKLDCAADGLILRCFMVFFVLFSGRKSCEAKTSAVDNVSSMFGLEMKISALPAMALLFLAGASHAAPSFSCSKALTTTERTICAVPRLAALDASYRDRIDEICGVPVLTGVHWNCAQIPD